MTWPAIRATRKIALVTAALEVSVPISRRASGYCRGGATPTLQLRVTQRARAYTRMISLRPPEPGGRPLHTCLGRRRRGGLIGLMVFNLSLPGSGGHDETLDLIAGGSDLTLMSSLSARRKILYRLAIAVLVACGGTRGGGGA